MSANSPSGRPSVRFRAARRWAGLLSLSYSTSPPLEAYQAVLALVPRVAWLGSSLHRRYEELPDIAEAVSEAAAAAIAAGDLACALEWLEEGRCVIWGQMLQLRTPLDDLRAVDLVLAHDLERISRALDVAGTSQGPKSGEGEQEKETLLEDEAQKHRRLAEEYERMVEKTRTLPGFEDFLRPKRLSHFRAATASGPVVVANINTERCDALILLPSSDAVRHIHLPALNHEDMNGWKDSMLRYLRQSGVRARGMRWKCPAAGEEDPMSSILTKLWSGIVQPVLLALAESSGDLWTPGDIPHVTWCATGPLGFLPLHAAGIYDDEAGPKVFDFVVSSYTPTLSALLEAGRRRGGHNRTGSPSILAVSQPGTPGQSSLPGTVAEVAAVQKIVGDLGLYLDGEKATMGSVLNAMADHNWIHLACHAHQHPQDPTKSAFILHDSRLELLSIMQRSFKHTELAFLSACQTATGDEKLTEEAVHLAAGMLTAGYQSVVATMWSIKDKDAPVIAEEFYLRLMKDGGDGRSKVAYALHAAVKHLRDEVGEREFVRPSGRPSTRFYAARNWAKLLSSPPSMSSPLEAYQVVLALVPRVVWLGFSLHRRYEELPDIAEAVSEAVAAATAAGDLACALEWLEDGRCVIWGQMLQLRTPLDDLRAVDSVLAHDLQQVSHALDIAGTSQGPKSGEEAQVREQLLEDEAQKTRRLAEEYERMVEKARTLPGLEDFLRPKKLAHFRAATDSGPVVVVNVAENRCDALIVLQASDTVLHVPLPAANHEIVAAWKDSMLQYLRGSGVRARASRQRLPAVGEQNSVLSILANLWSNIVQPVLNALAESSGELWTTGNIPHLTWCATGPLAFLPLHAAGIYDDKAGRKVFDSVVSSYTPALSALVEAGRGHSRSPTPSILAVSQPDTPGQGSLPGTIAEIAAVKKLVGAQGLYLDSEAATKDSVLAAMADHSWIHLACHAHQHVQDPTQSAFILHDSRLELLSIMQRSFKHTELAFLSACQTATGDEKLTEEAVHLAAGMLMAGYSSVVATMWSIMDKDAPVIAEEFYLRLMKDGGDGRSKVAYALHAAVKHLRDEVGEREFVRWVPFIHIGI
ncbi:CHAT domain-containing protein [Amylostereum chailletii]|nr:CHAT domain-containing protein [Amylostereum chailletii]